MTRDPIAGSFCEAYFAAWIGVYPSWGWDGASRVVPTGAVVSRYWALEFAYGYWPGVPG